MADSGGGGLSRLGPEFVALNISGGESIIKEDDTFKTRNVWRVSFYIVLSYQFLFIKRQSLLEENHSGGIYVIISEHKLFLQYSVSQL